MFDADVGGMPSGLCTHHEALPVWESSDRRHMTVAKKSISADARALLSFILGREVDIVALPEEQNLVAAFDQVMEACRTFQGTIQPSCSQSAEEAIEAMERGEQPQCCKPPEITSKQAQFMREIRTRYEHFLELFVRQKV